MFIISGYRRGGKTLTVTDANLYLGRLLPEFFPKIFGPKENQPLNTTAAVEAVGEMSQVVNAFLQEQGSPAMSNEEVVMGFLRVANEAMCRPIRSLTQGKGHDTSEHTLACFGGAGGQHGKGNLIIMVLLRNVVQSFLSVISMCCSQIFRNFGGDCSTLCWNPLSLWIGTC